MRYILNVDPRINISEDVANKLWKLPAYVAFTGKFDEDSASRFRESLEAAENAAIKCGQEVIPVTIDSYGGSVYALLGMIDAIKACSVKVATIVESKAMSCGAVLMSCGAEGHRYVSPNATVMIHTVSSGDFGKVDELKASVSEAERLNEKLFQIMAENCGKPKNYFLDLLKDRHMADWYLEADTCVKHNLANHARVPSIKVDVTCNFKIG